MKTTEKGERKYIKPELKVVKIDSKISLVMMSANPYHDPFESLLQKDSPTNDPFKTSLV